MVHVAVGVMSSHVGDILTSSSLGPQAWHSKVRRFRDHETSP